MPPLDIFRGRQCPLRGLCKEGAVTACSPQLKSLLGIHTGMANGFQGAEHMKITGEHSERGTSFGTSVWQGK